MNSWRAFYFFLFCYHITMKQYKALIMSLWLGCERKVLFRSVNWLDTQKTHNTCLLHIIYGLILAFGVLQGSDIAPAIFYIFSRLMSILVALPYLLLDSEAILHGVTMPLESMKWRSNFKFQRGGKKLPATTLLFSSTLAMW